MALRDIVGSEFGFEDLSFPALEPFPFAFVPRIHREPFSLLADFPQLGYRFVAHEGECGTARRGGEAVRVLGADFGGLFFNRDSAPGVLWGSREETLPCNASLLNFARCHALYVGQVCLLKSAIRDDLSPDVQRGAEAGATFAAFYRGLEPTLAIDDSYWGAREMELSQMFVELKPGMMFYLATGRLRPAP